MYLITGLLGVIIGALTAKRRKGKTLDILHYAAGYGIAFAIAGFILTLIIEKNFLWSAMFQPLFENLSGPPEQGPGHSR